MNGRVFPKCCCVIEMCIKISSKFDKSLSKKNIIVILLVLSSSEQFTHILSRQTLYGVCEQNTNYSSYFVSLFLLTCVSSIGFIYIMLYFHLHNRKLFSDIMWTILDEIRITLKIVLTRVYEEMGKWA